MSEPINLTSEKTKEWMRRLIYRANISGRDGEVPVSAVILNKQGKCIGQGSNTRNKDNDPLGHAEIIALRQASLIKQDWRFNDCTLIVTLEPCPMCTGALIQARMGQIIYGASDNKRGALGGAINLHEHKSAHHKIIVQGGVLQEEISKQIQNWFKEKRISNS